MFLHVRDLENMVVLICLFFFRAHPPSLRSVLANSPGAILDS